MKKISNYNYMFCDITEMYVWIFIKTVFRDTTRITRNTISSNQITRRVDVDFMKSETSVSTLILIPGASWEQLPWRTRLHADEAVIDQFLKSNVPNWPAAPVRSSSECLYLTKRRQSGHLSHRKVCSTTIHASCSSSEYPSRVRSLTKSTNIGYSSIHRYIVH